MLAARARNVQRLARSFATVVDTTGVKIAAVDNNQATSSVTVLVKAGSRFESKAGVANALKNFAFKVSAVVHMLICMVKSDNLLRIEHQNEVGDRDCSGK